MKKQLIAAGIVGAFSMGIATSGMAAQENTGCGLGTMVWDGQQGIAPQILAVTTNGTSGNQTFGITTGTLGCTSDGVVQSTEKLSMYLDSNLDGLAQDMSVGHGERLNVLAELMGVQEADKPAFFSLAKDNFADIFSSDEVTVGHVLTELDEAMAGDERLSVYAG